jgi:hypothetical protein
MKTIWKYEIPIEEKFEISMPIMARILSVQNQQRVPQMWCLVDSDKPVKTRKFIIVGTGHEVMHGNLTYIGTFLVHGDMLVLHLFEIMD